MSLAISSRLWRILRRDGIVIVSAAACCMLICNMQYVICDAMRILRGGEAGVSDRKYSANTKRVLHRYREDNIFTDSRGESSG